MKEILQKHKQYLLTGVSYVIPFIACGGILLALSIAMVPMIPGKGADFSNAPKYVQEINLIGTTAFNLFPAVLAGFISYGMAGKPGLVSGFIGGAIAGIQQPNGAKAGFLGAIIIGLVAGHITNLLKKLKVPAMFRPVMPIIVIPIFSAIPVGLLMLELNIPIAHVMDDMGQFLKNLQAGSQIILAMVLGAMIAFDMGGPVNKAAFFFGAAMIQQQNYSIMGACAAAICTPPLGLGLATLLSKKRWTDEQRESGLAALGMGIMGITEGAIPFAAADPLRVIPTIMFGSMIASTIAMLGGVGDYAPHGGPIVLPIVDHRLMYVVAILCGVTVTAITMNLVKKLTEKNPATTGGAA
jgi:PTS system fructose-specific IIC component